MTRETRLVGAGHLGYVGRPRYFEQRDPNEKRLCALFLVVMMYQELYSFVKGLTAVVAQ